MRRVLENIDVIRRVRRYYVAYLPIAIIACVSHSGYAYVMYVIGLGAITLMAIVMLAIYMRPERSRLRHKCIVDIAVMNGGLCVVAVASQDAYAVTDWVFSMILTFFVVTGGTLLCGAVIGNIAYRVLRTSRVFMSATDCAGCGYDLTGNVSGRCPECGRRVDMEQMRK